VGLGDQTGERHLRIRARSPTGSVAGAASYVNGLSAQGANHGLPHLRSPHESPSVRYPATLNTPPDTTTTIFAPTILIPVCRAKLGNCEEVALLVIEFVALPTIPAGAALHRRADAADRGRAPVATCA
jgi:hypothetical protein